MNQTNNKVDAERRRRRTRLWLGHRRMDGGLAVHRIDLVTELHLGLPEPEQIQRDSLAGMVNLLERLPQAPLG